MQASALAEFIVVDRHRTAPTHRLGAPRRTAYSCRPCLPSRSSRSYRYARCPRTAPSARSCTRSPQARTQRAPPCRSTAHSRLCKAARRRPLPGAEHAGGVRRCELVLRRHDAVGALAVQHFSARRWRVSVHVPSGVLAPHAAPARGARTRSCSTTARAARSACSRHCARLDCVGRKVAWAAGERLLRAPGGAGGVPLRRDAGQFTTLVGHTPARVVPSAGLRALHIGSVDVT